MQRGRTWSIAYHAGDDVADLLEQASSLFISEGSLSTMAFPSPREFETEVVSITLSFLSGADETVGSTTSGDTESVLLAVETALYLAQANKPEITAPEMVLPLVALPAFEKAAQHLSVRSVRAHGLVAMLVGKLVARSSYELGPGEANVPTRAAAFYGIMPSHPNRGAISEPMLELREQLSGSREEPTALRGQGTE